MKYLLLIPASIAMLGAVMFWTMSVRFRWPHRWPDRRVRRGRNHLPVLRHLDCRDARPMSGFKADRKNCIVCGDTGRVERPITADHILTDTQPWAPCPKGCEPLSDRELRMKWECENGVVILWR